jgi:phenylpropionate dioxygenase-like ring-hydroxylating dioxygenase large terminal subunit
VTDQKTPAPNPRQIEMGRRNIAHAENKTVDQADGVMRVPSWKYVDPTRWQREVDEVFRRVPLLLAVGGELPAPGDYKSMVALDVPVLVVRGDDGLARAYLNACAHRGAPVAAQGHGHVTRFSCPYHNWTYDREGSLVAVTDGRDFGDIDKACHGLTPLPVAERAGLIFGSITPGAAIDIDAWLEGFEEELSWFDFASWRLVTTNEVAGPNWKLAFDGYVDFYHLPFLHKATFGPDMFRTASYDFWGPHIRMSTPAPELVLLRDKPEHEWPLDAIAGGIHALFPHVSFATSSRGGMVSVLWPGPTPDTSRTIQYHFLPHEPTDHERDAVLENAEFLLRVVRDEDYAMGAQIQRGLQVGARREILFGQNEGGGQHYHRWLDHLLDGAPRPNRPHTTTETVTS